VARGKKHDDTTRAAVMAALLAGQSVDEVARQYNLPQQTVSEWKAQIDPARFGELRFKKETDFGELLAEYLEETIITLQAQARFFRNETWLKKQSASDLAVLHGVQTDKAIRILECAERARGLRSDGEDMDPSVGPTN
jgi:transposase-like protein